MLEKRAWTALGNGDHPILERQAWRLTHPASSLLTVDLEPQLSREKEGSRTQCFTSQGSPEKQNLEDEERELREKI